MCKAFQWAHQVDPNPVYFYNDYNHGPMDGWYKTKADRVYKVVKDLKNRGCHTNAVGF